MLRTPIIYLWKHFLAVCFVVFVLGVALFSATETRRKVLAIVAGFADGEEEYASFLTKFAINTVGQAIIRWSLPKEAS